MEKNDRRCPPRPPGRPHPPGHRPAVRSSFGQPTIRPNVFEHLAQSFVSDAIRRTPKSDWKPRKITGFTESYPGSPANPSREIGASISPPTTYLLPPVPSTHMHTRHVVTWPQKFSLPSQFRFGKRIWVVARIG